MTLNHIAYLFLPEQAPISRVMEYTGYFTAVTMCFFLVEGYHRTSSPGKYLQRLFTFAVLAEVPYYLALSGNDRKTAPGNMLFTLTICFLIICAFERLEDRKTLRIAVILALAGLTLFCDWAGLAAYFTILFCMAYKGEMSLRNAYINIGVVYGVLMAGNYLMEGQSAGSALLLGCLSTTGIWVSAFCVICLYNGREGSRSRFWKWFFYLYYPLHLTVLLVIRQCMRG